MNKQILVADDSKSLLKLYIDILGKKEDNVLKVFLDGKYLLEYFSDAYRKGNRIPLCILDMRMPIMDGFTTATELRKIDPDVVIIIVSAHKDVSIDIIKENLKNDIYYIKKPFNQEEFYCLVDSLVKGWNKDYELNLYGGQLEQLVKDRTDELSKVTEMFHQAQKMEALGALAGGIAHDFNNILTPIISYTDIILEEIPVDNVTIRDYLRRVLEAAYRAKELVKQILTFSRQSEEERNPLQVSIIIKEALKLLRASLPYNIDIRENIQARSSMILGDPTQIYQILMNLCTNAIHAMKEKGGHLDICLSEEDITSEDSSNIDIKPGSYVRLSVNDTGHGIDKEIIGKIFEPYFTTKKSGEGTGFGLSLVHGIVKKYGGEIRVYSEKNIGTTFNIYFPRLCEMSGYRPEAIDSVPLGQERVLVVDDEKYVVELLHNILKKLGYKVTATTDSINALDIFKKDPEAFELIITDQTMPGMTGTELAKEILAIRPDMPVILCTGFAETISPEKAKLLGIREFIPKPVTIKILAESIRKVLDSKPEMYKNHILLVEDNTLNCEVIHKILTRFDYKVNIARTGKDALTALEKENYDLILMDVELPDMTGFDISGFIRNRENPAIRHDIPIVAMTGYVFSDIYDSFIASEMNDYISKPVEAKEILRVIKNNLSGVTDKEKTLQSRITEKLIVNRGKLLDNLGNDNEFCDYILNKYLELIPPMIKELKKYISEGNFEAIKAKSHEIAGSSANVEAEILRDIAFEIEKIAKEEDIERIRSLITQMEKEFKKIKVLVIGSGK